MTDPNQHTLEEPDSRGGEGEIFFDPERSPAETIAEGKRLLAEARERMLETNRKGGRQACRAFARFHDHLIRGIWKYVQQRQEAAGQGPAGSIAILAAGGYGRRDLSARSDVDVIFLVGSKKLHREEPIKEAMHLLIDIGLDLGFAVRRHEDCLAVLGADLQSTTSTMEARFLAGSRPLFQRTLEAFYLELRGRWRRWFLRAKYEEWTERRRQYDTSVYMLQPNVKEGAGGLRDVHSVRWALWLAAGSPELSGLAKVADFSEEDVKRYRDAEEVVMQVRNELHGLSPRKNDVLAYDAQVAIARRLGYAGRENARPEEELMRDYYHAARDVARLSNRALLTILRKEKNVVESLMQTLRSRRLDKVWLVRDEAIELDARHASWLEGRPDRILGAFALAAENGLRVGEETRDRIEKIVANTPPEAWDAPEIHAAFMRLLSRNRGVARTLADMHDCGALCAYIPEFERIRCMVRIDYYHRYTVDEHLLHAVQFFERLVHDPKLRATAAGRVAASIARVDLLNLALLLHDVGKGYGKGHALLGGGIVQRIGHRMGLPHDDVEIVRFLVLSHLKFSHVSQRRDPEDPRVGRDLADEIGTRERLDLLYVHSVCDLMAVGPDAWNDWKASLYEACHRSAGAAIEGRPVERAPVDRLRADAAERLWKRIEPQCRKEARESGEPVEKTRRRLDEFIVNVPPRYLQQMPAETIERHFGMLRGLGEETRIRWELERGLGVSDLAVVSYDLPGSFGMICGALAAKELNILGADIFSTDDGFAINDFRLTDLDGRPLPEGFRLDKLLSDLNNVFHERLTMAELIEKHRPRLPSARPARTARPTEVEVVDDGSQEFTIIEVRTSDRPGLLYRVAKVFGELRLNIHRAMVSTEAYGVFDVFFVTDYEYNKIHDAPKIQRIKEALVEAIDGEAKTDPEAGAT